MKGLFACPTIQQPAGQVFKAEGKGETRSANRLWLQNTQIGLTLASKYNFNLINECQ